MDVERRVTPLYATVPPIASLLLWREGRAWMLDLAARYEARGANDAARELRFTVEQLEACAKQLTNRELAAAVGSASGTSEVGSSTSVESSRGMRTELTTAQVADLMGTSRRYVTELIATERLVARRQGRAWLVDSGSVDDLIASRGAA